MNTSIIMLQNTLLTFYFELRLQVRRMENITLTKICRLLASSCAIVISTPILGRIRAGIRARFGLWTLEWAWHIRETNLRCVQSNGI